MSAFGFGPVKQALLEPNLADELTKRAVWNKGHAIEGYDPAEWRRDDFGNMIQFSAYGDRDSPHGWEKDHIVPRGLLGGDDLANLRPLHCGKNASLGGILGRLLTEG